MITIALPKTQQEWRIAEAKNKLSEVMDRALAGEPQRIVRRGRVAILVDEETWQRQQEAKMSFVEFLLSIPKMGDDFELPSRDSFSREIDL
ncbi:MAG TPA: type II toxin-antitoxin system prevent-host-death family antitoxin [Thermomicrobiales bacterium]|nr:type II toxin-antitoxin system prevent-host-death family antitoxin [Thermomicrobiales bacterium]